MMAYNFRHAWQKLLMVVTPMRTPVNEPGPVDTAKQSIFSNDKQFCLRRKSVISRMVSEYRRGSLIITNPITLSRQLKATPPQLVAVSMAKTFITCIYLIPLNAPITRGVLYDYSILKRQRTRVFKASLIYKTEGVKAQPLFHTGLLK